MSGRGSGDGSPPVLPSARDMPKLRGARRTAGELEAGLVAGILRSAVIEAHLLSHKASANVVAFGGLFVIRVLVPAFLHEAAAALLREEGLRGQD